MNSVPYLAINILACCSFIIIFVTFLAARSTPETKWFLALIFGFIVWSGGSVLMRLQMFPGLSFWYYVSIMAFFTLAALAYSFVCVYVRAKGYFLKHVWWVATLLLLIATPFGIILAPPAAELGPRGWVFTYDMHWPVAIPYVLFLLIIASILVMSRNAISKNGVRAHGGISYIIAGSLLLALGNLLQLLPGNVFPWDTLSGIVFALLLMFALYKKRMFRLTLIVSRTVLLVICGGICLAAAAYCIAPAEGYLEEIYKLSPQVAITAVSLVFSGVISGAYILLKRLINILFLREEHQGKLLQSFSSAVCQSLSTDEIMSQFSSIIKSEINVRSVYICLKTENGFSARHSSGKLESADFTISADSPCLKYLKDGDSCIIMREFVSDPLYMSVWRSERELLKRYSVAVIAALRDGDEIVGLTLLSEKERGGEYNNTEIGFLETASSVASIALKNAGLYEQMYREARIDKLTGVYNYSYFMEKLSSDFKACGKEALALIYVDIDDFKLYNQLYGAVEGDRVLMSVSSIITLCTGKAGTVFRNSGKVFAVLLPGFDGRRANALANEMSRRIEGINDSADRQNFKKITASLGVCVSPYAASSARELMENADLAVYNAKGSGKNCVMFFKGTAPGSTTLADRAMEIVERSRDMSGAYQTNSATIFALTAAIDAKDHYTYKHSHNVAFYASVLATAAGLNDDQISIIYESALLHDIGKISIPENILGKTGMLSDSEYDVMKGHVNSAIDMIRYLPSMDYVIPAAVGHHERWDGKGYPQGLAGPDIPISARCLALADAYDAMTTDRPYRKALTPEYAADQIEKSAGTQFDPELAAIFVTIIRTGEFRASTDRRF